LRLIIDAGGGSVLDNLNAKEVGVITNGRRVLVAMDTLPTAAQKSQEDKIVEKLGDAVQMETTSWLFQCIINQKNCSMILQ